VSLLALATLGDETQIGFFLFFVASPEVAKASNASCSCHHRDSISLWVSLSLSPALSRNHRYQKAKIDCLSFVMYPLLAQPIIAFFSSFFAAAVYSTNEANKAGSTRH